MATDRSPRMGRRFPRMAASIGMPRQFEARMLRSPSQLSFEEMPESLGPDLLNPLREMYPGNDPNVEELSSHLEKDCQVAGASGGEPAAPKTGLEVLQMNWDMLQGQPALLLHQYVQHTGVTLVYVESNSPAPSLLFTMYTVVDGITCPEGSGSSKREAKNRAAYLALCKLRKILESQEEKNSELVSKPIQQKDQPMEPPPIENIISHEERCAALCSDMFDRLLERLPEYQSCKSSLAAFIMGRVTLESQDSNDDIYEVVALGTGEATYTGCMAFNGLLLHDAHGLVVARRALQRFLYKHLLLFHAGSPLALEKSIFCSSKENGILSLKPNVFFHLYLSQVPAGAAENFHNPGNVQDLSLTLHVHAKGVLKPVSYCRPCVLTARVCCMSGSDKLTRWNIVGMQGALLSLFIKPIYITSVILGSLELENSSVYMRSLGTMGGMADTHTLSKVINGRLEPYEGTGLPRLYRPNHIHVFNGPQVSSPHCDPSCRTLSLNWSKGDCNLEIVDGASGKVTDKSPAQDGLSSSSQLCKAAMLAYFWRVLTVSSPEDVLEVPKYHLAKVKAEDYQMAKGHFYNHLIARGLGTWPRKLLVDDFGLLHKASGGSV